MLYLGRQAIYCRFKIHRC